MSSCGIAAAESVMVLIVCPLSGFQTCLGHGGHTEAPEPVGLLEFMTFVAEDPLISSFQSELCSSGFHRTPDVSRDPLTDLLAFWYQEPLEDP